MGAGMPGESRKSRPPEHLTVCLTFALFFISVCIFVCLFFRVNLVLMLINYQDLCWYGTYCTSPAIILAVAMQLYQGLLLVGA